MNKTTAFLCPAIQPDKKNPSTVCTRNRWYPRKSSPKTPQWHHNLETDSGIDKGHPILTCIRGLSIRSLTRIAHHAVSGRDCHPTLTRAGLNQRATVRVDTRDRKLLAQGVIKPTENVHAATNRQRYRRTGPQHERRS